MRVSNNCSLLSRAENAPSAINSSAYLGNRVIIKYVFYFEYNALVYNNMEIFDSLD